jgi:hypothetical protein
MPDWRIIPGGCEVCMKEISNERIIDLEELNVRSIASEELQACLVMWEELQARSSFAFLVD